MLVWDMLKELDGMRLTCSLSKTQLTSKYRVSAGDQLDQLFCQGLQGKGALLPLILFYS